MIKGPSYFAQWYGTGRRSFLEAARGYRIPPNWTPDSKMDMGEVEARVLAALRPLEPWAAAAGATLAAVNADPRNHFGKHALRRFDNENRN